MKIVSRHMLSRGIPMIATAGLIGCGGAPGKTPTTADSSVSAAATAPARRGEATNTPAPLGQHAGAVAGSAVMSRMGDGLAMIGPAGGTVELAGVGSVRFLPNTFARPTPVAITRTQDPSVSETYRSLLDATDPGTKTSHEMRVVLGAEQPLGHVQVRLKLPEELRARTATGDAVCVHHLDVYDDEETERIVHTYASSECGRPSDDFVTAWKQETDFQPGPDGRMQGLFFLAVTPSTRPSPAPPARR